MNKGYLLDLLDKKRSVLSDRVSLEETSKQEISLLEGDRKERNNIFLYEVRDVRKIARLIILLDALNSSRSQFQIEQFRLFERARTCYRDFTAVTSAENLTRVVNSYNTFVDREMRLKPFDDSYLALTKIINTILGVAENQGHVARRLCRSQAVYLENFYSTLGSIQFRKDRFVRERYEDALRRLNQ